MTIRVVSYARYSDDLQNDKSVEDQVRDHVEKADREGWAIIKYYSDHGISGESLQRDGIQELLADLKEDKFDIVLAETLSRISRDLSESAYIDKLCKFHGVRIFTLAEGFVTNMHVAFKGLQNQQFLEDLKIQVRRGQRGRVKEGKIGSGLAYGYAVVKKFDAKGEVIRGEREIIAEQAEIVLRIFEEYAAGKSPRAICKALNVEGIPSPSGRQWNPSTINGHRERGYGILNNDLYRGLITWNKTREYKEPGTNRRVPRPNPRSEWVYHEAEHLRVVSDELWETVKKRQGDLDTRTSWRKKKRPKYLLSGLLKCGKCGSNYVMTAHSKYGCSAHMNKGTCDNSKKIKRVELESAILSGLRGYLMSEDLLAEFCSEFTRHVNDIRKQKNMRVERTRKELAKVEKDFRRCIDAIKDGIAAHLIKDEIEALDARKSELENTLEQSDEAPAYLHPRMADHYKRQVDELIAVLDRGEHSTAARNAIRGLIEGIVLVPDEESGNLIVNLHGDLAGILAIAEQKESSTMQHQNRTSSDGVMLQMVPLDSHGLYQHATVQMVVGERLELSTSGL